VAARKGVWVLREVTIQSAAPALVVVVEKEAPIRFNERLMHGERELRAWEEFINSRPELGDLLQRLFVVAGGLGPGDHWETELGRRVASV
jgi:hypothetical protein